MTQKTKVKNRILEVGYVDNFWAIGNYILRLGAIVYQLRREGMRFRGAFGKELGKERAQWKNYYYVQEQPTSLLQEQSECTSCYGMPGSHHTHKKVESEKESKQKSLL